jgi:hypothetical protein
MKKLILLLTVTFALLTYSRAQEFADFTLTGTHQGTGTFTNAALSDFTWQAVGALAQEVQILDDEIFDDGNQFENTFGQADYAENIRIQNFPNGDGMAGYPVISISQLTLNFDETTPDEGWGFCLVDIDVEQCLISAIDENDNEVSVEAIDNWLIELFDANIVSYGVNIPKWDASHAALLGSDTPEDYVVYNNLVIGGLNDSEAAAAFFMPDIPLKSLTIVYENLQEVYFTSYHFYIASVFPTGTHENDEIQLSIYPNPAGSWLTIQHSASATGQATIYNVIGKTVLQTELQGRRQAVDVSGLPGGIYFCRITVDNKTVTKKLLIE